MNKIINTEEEYFKLLNTESNFQKIVGIDPFYNQKNELMKYVSDDLKNNKSFVIKAISKNADAYKYISEKLKNDREVIVTLLLSDLPSVYIYNIPDNLTDDYSVATKIVKKQANVYAHLSDNLKESRELMKEALSVFPELIVSEDVSIKFRNDKKLILFALNNPILRIGSFFKKLPLKYQNDREVVLKAIKCNSRTIEYINDDLKNDEEIFLEALKNSRNNLFNQSTNNGFGSEIIYASDNLKKDKNFIIKAINIEFNCINYIKYINKDIIDDPDICFEIYKNNPERNKITDMIIYDLCNMIINNKNSNKNDLLKAKNILLDLHINTEKFENNNQKQRKKIN